MGQHSYDGTTLDRLHQTGLRAARLSSLLKLITWSQDGVTCHYFMQLSQPQLSAAPSQINFLIEKKKWAIVSFKRTISSWVVFFFFKPLRSTVHSVISRISGLKAQAVVTVWSSKGESPRAPFSGELLFHSQCAGRRWLVFALAAGGWSISSQGQE